MKTCRQSVVSVLAMILMLFACGATAESRDHNMVIQVNTKDTVSQKMAMVNAGNLKNLLGADNIDVEVVIYGPGLSLVEADSVFKKRIGDLQEKGVRFSVCEGTLKSIKERTGEDPQLLPGIGRVRTGALRILELQEQGYAYMRP